MTLSRTISRHQVMGLALWALVIAGAGVGAASAKTDGGRARSVETITKQVAANADAADVSTAPSTTALDPSTTTPTTTGLQATTSKPTKPATSSGGGGATTGGTNPTTAPSPPTTLRVATQQLQPTPGSYPVAITGTATLNGSPQDVPSSGTLVIDQQSDTDQHQGTPSGPADVDLVLRYSQTRADLVSLKLQASAITKTFQPTAGSPYLRFDGPVGASWSWKADSTDSKTHIAFAASITREDVAMIGGQPVPVVVVDATLTISGDVTGTARLTTWVAKAERLPVIQRQVINASASMYGMTAKLVSDTTATMTRLTAS
jgi:hypothetical protein